MSNDLTLRRRVLNVCLKSSIALIVLAAMLAIYSDYTLNRAEKQVRTFSQALVVGMPPAGLEEKAGEMGLKFRRTAGSSAWEGSFQVWKGVAFGRWFCEVEYRDGKVSNKRVTFLD